MAKFYVDGVQVLDVPKCNRSESERERGARALGEIWGCGHFFDVGYHLVLNTAIGGFWPEPPDPSTVFPGYHRVDYVRVAQRKSRVASRP